MEKKSDLHLPTMAVYQMAMQRWPNGALAAFNNAIHGFGKIDRANAAYGAARRDRLIEKSGAPSSGLLEELRTASTREVNRRVESGGFG